MTPLFFAFLVDFLFLSGFLVSFFFVLVGFLFPIFLEFLFSDWCVLFFSLFTFLPDPPGVREKKKRGNSHSPSSARTWRPENLMESKFPAIIDWYNWFSDIHIDS